MQPKLDIRFHRCAVDSSLSATVHRWIARFLAMHFEVTRADVVFESAARRTAITLTLVLADERTATAATSHVDPYVAISDAFRDVRHQLLGHATAPRRRSTSIRELVRALART